MRVNQKGSIISFIIVGALLGLAALSVFYWLGHRSSDITQVKEPEVTVPGATEPKNTDSSQETPSSGSDKNTATPQANDGSSSSSSSSAQTTEDLPQTGPTENLMTLLSIGLLTVAGVAYVRSRRPAVSL